MADPCDSLVRVVRAFRRQHRIADNPVPEQVFREVADAFTDLSEAERIKRAQLIFCRIDRLTDDAQDAIPAFFRAIEGGGPAPTRVLDAVLEILPRHLASEFITIAGECAEAFASRPEAMQGLRIILRSVNDPNTVKGTFFHLRFLDDVGPPKFARLEGVGTGDGVRRGLDAELLPNGPPHNVPPYRGGRYFELKSGSDGLNVKQVSAHFARTNGEPDKMRFVLNPTEISRSEMVAQADKIWGGIQAISDQGLKDKALRYLFGSEYDPTFDYDNLVFGDDEHLALGQALPEMIRRKFIIEHAVAFD